MDELKSCPFCGGKAKIRGEKYWRPRVSRNVICTKCFSCSGWFDTEEEAVEAWDRRIINEVSS